jgi:hypothetical protein
VSWDRLQVHERIEQGQGWRKKETKRENWGKSSSIRKTTGQTELDWSLGLVCTSVGCFDSLLLCKTLSQPIQSALTSSN